MNAGLDPTPAMPYPHIPRQEKSNLGWILLILLILGSPCLVIGVFYDPFFHTSDRTTILENPLVIEGFSSAALRQIGAAPAEDDLKSFLGKFCPLTKLSIGVQYALFGQNVWCYRLINLLLHLCSALMLYRIIVSMMPGIPGSSIGSDTLNIDSTFRGKGLIPAAIGAALFFFHPAVVETVAIPGNHAYALSLFLCILSWRMIVAHGPSEQLWMRIGAPGPYVFLIALLVYLLALLANPAAIGFSVVFVLLELLLVFGSPSERIGRAAGFLLIAGCWLVMGIAIRDNAIRYDFAAELQALPDLLLIGLLPWPSPERIHALFEHEWLKWSFAGGVTAIALGMCNWLPLVPRRLSALFWGILAVLAIAQLSQLSDSGTEKALYMTLPLVAATVAFICDGAYYRMRFLGSDTGKAIAKIGVFLLVLYCFTLAAGSLKRTLDLANRSSVAQQRSAVLNEVPEE